MGEWSDWNDMRDLVSKAQGRIDRRPLVILESPFAGDVEGNIEYARRCVKHSLELGEAPIASHLLYTQPGILDDTNPAERQWGIDAGLAWRHVADLQVVHLDKGFSTGMAHGMRAGFDAGLEWQLRRLDGNVTKADHEMVERILEEGQ